MQRKPSQWEPLASSSADQRTVVRTKVALPRKQPPRMGRCPSIQTPSQFTNPPRCTALPLIVTTAALDGTTTPPSADNTRAASVTVTYQTVPLIPIPGLLMSQFTFTRNVQMRVKGS